jgi:hypothetical protein
VLGRFTSQNRAAATSRFHVKESAGHLFQGMASEVPGGGGCCDNGGR